MYFLKTTLFVLFFQFCWLINYGQTITSSQDNKQPSAQASTYIDQEGVFRYVENNKEIRLFGANYTLPFAHGYRAINYLNKDHKKAIDQDIYHMTLLGLDAHRVHIWDAEVTDSLGNLIQTPQLDLLDYTLAKYKDRGFKTIITPFKVGENGYPEKDFETPGFSSKLQKQNTYSGEAILAKQKRYFTQLLNHVNPYTGIAYKNDPDIIAIEINNEPKHTDGKEALTYINTMVDIIREIGFKNPVFYNVAEVSAFVDDYTKANIQGCTFQWYPTGLVHNSQLKGNFLPHVDHYNIPFDTLPEFQNKARIIYEFDSGDTNSSVIFPAMARSFREAKFQFATQFAYEPTDLAFANTEYQTHFTNLIYTPSKAISLKIAAQVFHETENGKSYGRYPNNNHFGKTELFPQKDLAVYNSKSKFFYTNTTSIKPTSPKKLKQLAGVGNSEIVKYTGNGAYFLHKIKNGLWRLEVLPDVLWVKDPYEKASLKKTVAVIKKHSNLMKVNLTDLGDRFKVTGINKGNSFKTESNSAAFYIEPGTYLLHSKPLQSNFNFKKQLDYIKLNEYFNFSQNLTETYVVHQPKAYIEKGQDLPISLQLVSSKNIQKIEVVLPSGYQKTDHYKFTKTGNFNYEVNIPKEKLWGNNFSYNVVVYTEKDTISYPKAINGSPADWDFVSKNQYATKIVNPEKSILLFEANQLDFKNFLWPNYYSGVKYNMEIQSFKDQSKDYLSISAPSLDTKIKDLTFKIMLNDLMELEQQNLKEVNQLVVKASSGFKPQQKVQIALQLSNAKVFGKVIEFDAEVSEIEIPFSELKNVPMVLLPNAYPGFQHYWFQSEAESEFDASLIEALQISIGPGLETLELSKNQNLSLYQIRLE